MKDDKTVEEILQESIESTLFSVPYKKNEKKYRDRLKKFSVSHIFGNNYRVNMWTTTSRYDYLHVAYSLFLSYSVERGIYECNPPLEVLKRRIHDDLEGKKELISHDVPL